MLGEGATGHVYRALDRLTGQVIALKNVLIPTEHLVIATRSDPRTDFRVALAQEFQLLSALRHPGIIGVFDYGFDDDRQPFLAMELIENAQGPSRQQYLTQAVETFSRIGAVYQAARVEIS